MDAPRVTSALLLALLGCSFNAEVPPNLRCGSTDDCRSVGGVCVIRADAGGICCLTSDCLPPDGGPAKKPPEQLAWTAPATIPTGPTRPINPRLASDAAGNVAVVWQDELGGLMQLWWNRRRAGAAWEMAELVQDDFGYSDGHPDDWATRIAINGRHAYVAWRTIYPQVGGGPRTVLRHFSDDAGWDKPAMFTGYGPPSVIAQADGGLALFCSDTGDYYYSRHRAGSGWSDPERIGDGCIDPAVAANQSGGVMAATTTGKVVTTAVYAPESRSWMVSRMDPLSLSPSLWMAPQAAIALNDAGDGLIGWLAETGDGSNSLWISTSLGFGPWEKPMSIDKQFGASPPRVALSDAGGAVMVWQHLVTGDQPFDVMVSRRDPDGWTTPERLGGGANDLQSPQVALDRDGNGVAVWVQHDSDGGLRVPAGHDSIWASRLLSTGWGMARRIGDDPTTATGTPSLVMDGAGRAVAVWRVGSILRWSALE